MTAFVLQGHISVYNVFSERCSQSQTCLLEHCETQSEVFKRLLFSVLELSTVCEVLSL